MTGAFLQALLFFLIGIAIHIPLSRISGNQKFVFRGLLLEFVLGLAMTLASIGFLELAPSRTYLLVSLLCFVCLWNLYLFFIINLQNSFSLRMLSEIAASPTQSLSKEALDEVFSDKAAFEARLKALSLNGFIKIDISTQSVRVTFKGRLMSLVLSSLRSLLRIRTYG